MSAAAARDSCQHRRGRSGGRQQHAGTSAARLTARSQNRGSSWRARCPSARHMLQPVLVTAHWRWQQQQQQMFLTPRFGQSRKCPL